MRCYMGYRHFITQEMCKKHKNTFYKDNSCLIHWFKFQLSKLLCQNKVKRLGS